MSYRLTSVLLAVAASGFIRAGSITIDIDATKYGCSSCNSYSNTLPGVTLSSIFTPKLQLTLGPGTYTITNGDTTPGDMYSAWNYQGPVSGNWVWSFIIANDANSKVLMDDFTSGQFATQSLAASATGLTTYDGSTVLSGTSVAGFTDTLVLTATTTLDFLIDDYGLGDNAGGVALTITGPGIGDSSVPEPGSFFILGAGLLGLAARRLFR